MQDVAHPAPGRTIVAMLPAPPAPSPRPTRPDWLGALATLVPDLVAALAGVLALGDGAPVGSASEVTKS